jgi:hypothetical protein
MIVFLATIVGLVLWLVLWSINVKAFDAFMLTVLIIVIAAAVQSMIPFLPGNREDRPGRRGI